MRRELNPARARWHDRREHGECGRCGTPLPEGHDKATCGACLVKVREGIREAYYRRRGIPMPENARAWSGRYKSEKWAAIDEAKRCDRCGLRGEHVCTPSRADGSRRVAWDIL